MDWTGFAALPHATAVPSPPASRGWDVPLAVALGAGLEAAVEAPEGLVEWLEAAVPTSIPVLGAGAVASVQALSASARGRDRASSGRNARIERLLGQKRQVADRFPDPPPTLGPQLQS